MMPPALVALGSLAVVAAWVASSATGSAQQERAQFRGGTDIVSLYATVVDRQRRLVSDLREEHFVVTDDGRRQALAFFTNDVQPFSVVLMIDCSGTMTDHLNLPRSAAIEFVRTMRPDDRALVGSFADQIRFGPDEFTGNQGELIGVLQRDLQRPGASPVWTAIDRSIDRLVPLTGRRVVLVLTDGHDAPNWNQPHTKLGFLKDRARTADVMIYTIGFSASSESFYGAARGPFGFPPGGGSARTNPLLSKRVQPPDPALKDLAEVSGGAYFELGEKEDLGALFRRVSEELRHQYWMGFTPSKLDGKRHEIGVKVSRPDLEVRARRHYIASPAGKAP